MKLQNFTYRKPREKKPEPQVPDKYWATIYSISESTNRSTGEKSLYVNVEIGTEYQYGINFRLNAEDESKRSYAEYSFSKLIDACGIDGETFDGETDALLGKTIMLTLKPGQYRLQATKFEPVEQEQQEQQNAFDYNKQPNFMDDELNDNTPF